jgi:integrin beta 3
MSALLHLLLAFTINSIQMKSLPDWEVSNGQNLTLQCVVDVSTTSQIKTQHLMLFYKDDLLIHNVTSTESVENYFILQARVFTQERTNAP